MIGFMTNDMECHKMKGELGFIRFPPQIKVLSCLMGFPSKLTFVLRVTRCQIRDIFNSNYSPGNYHYSICFSQSQKMEHGIIPF